MRNANGTFATGNTFATGGRKLGAKNKLTRLFEARLEQEAENDTFHVGDFLIDIVRDPMQTPELRAKADSKLLDIVTKSAEDAPEQEIKSIEQINKEITEKLYLLFDNKDFVCLPKEMLTPEQIEYLKPSK